MPSPNAIVSISIRTIRENCKRISEMIHESDLLAVVKADAYGFGVEKISNSILDIVDGLCVFDLNEAIRLRQNVSDKVEIITLGFPSENRVNHYIEYKIRPVVFTKEQAIKMQDALPLLSIDTGMQRFSCPAEESQIILQERLVSEAITHAVNLRQVEIFKKMLLRYNIKRHATGSSLLSHPEAFLDAVRPGIALYNNAIRVTTYVAECHKSWGKVGYTGFSSNFHGVIPVGYFHGLRRGICSVEGEICRILEVGMQTAYIELLSSNWTGKEVILLGEDISLSQISEEWGTTLHEALVTFSRMGERIYVDV